MSTFDAGAIEAQLILDRSNFQKGLTAARAQAKRMDGTEITVNLDIDDIEDLVALEGLIESVDNKDVAINVDVDNDSLGNLVALEAIVEELDGKSVDIEVNLKPRGIIPRLVTLRENLEAIRDVVIEFEARGVASVIKDANLIEHEIEDVPTHHTTFFETVGLDTANRRLDMWRALILGVMALLPVLSASVGVLGGGIAALSGILVGAGGAAGVLALGIFAILNHLTAFQERIGPVGDAARMVTENLKLMNLAWHDFADAIALPGLSLLNKGLQLVAQVLPGLAPVFNAVAAAAEDALDGLAAFFGGQEWKGILDFFEDFGADAFGGVLDIIGNLTLFIVRLAQAFEPLSRDMIEGLDRITQGWADWAKEIKGSEGLIDFMDWVRDTAPDVIDLLVAFGDALIEIGIALAPFAGPMIEGLTNFFEFIADIPPEVLGPIALGVFTLVGAFKLLMPLVTGLMAVWPGLVAVLGAIASPAGLIAGAIAGIGAAVGLAIADSEEAQATIGRIWQDISDTIVPIVEDIVAVFEDEWPDIQVVNEEVWEDFVGTIEAALVAIEERLRPFLDAIDYAWEMWGADLTAWAIAWWSGLGGIFSAGLEVISGIITAWTGIMTGDFKMWGDGVKQAARGLWNGIKSIYKMQTELVLVILRGFASAGITALQNMRREAVQRVAAMATSVRERITGLRAWMLGRASSFASAVRGWFTSIPGRVGDAIGDVKTKIGGMITWLRGVPGRITSALGNMWKVIGTAASAAVGVAKSAINSVIRGWNNLSFTLPSFTIKLPGPAPDISFGGGSVGTPNIPYLAKGGVATDATLAMVGEGKESEAILPLSELSRLLDRERNATGGTMDVIWAKIIELLEAILAREPIEYHDHGERNDPRGVAEDLWLLTKGRG